MKIVLFGAGHEGEKFLRYNWGKIEFEYVMDNGEKAETFYGLSVRKPAYYKDTFIIVASSLYYLEIRQQLIDLGYCEFKDFIPHSIWKKKMAIAYGNCHMDVIREYLERNKYFAKEYGFYPLPMIQDLKKELLAADIVSHAELLLHQAIRENNKCGYEFSSKDVISRTSPVCKVISMPNLYGMPKCFFPQLRHYSDKIRYHYTVFGLEDENVTQWIQEGLSKADIKNKICLGGIYSEQEIIQMWEEFKRKLIIREAEWDIKISDYILENYQKMKLFNEPWHIKSEMAGEITVRLLKYMGYGNAEIPYILPRLDDCEAFIYPDVVNALDLKYEEKIIRNYFKGRCHAMVDMDFDEYIDELYNCTVMCYLDDKEEI